MVGHIFTCSQVIFQVRCMHFNVLQATKLAVEQHSATHYLVAAPRSGHRLGMARFSCFVCKAALMKRHSVGMVWLSRDIPALQVHTQQ